MNQYDFNKRLERVEENVIAIRKMLELLMGKETMIPEKKAEDEFMSVKQLRRFLGIESNIIYSKCTRGEIPCFKLGKQFRFKKEEILKWMQNQKVKSEFSVEDYVERYMQKNLMKG